MLSDSKKRIIRNLTFLFCVVLVFLVFFIIYPGIAAPLQANRIINAKHSLKVARRSIELFKGDSGRWPESLSELTKHPHTFPNDPNQVPNQLTRLPFFHLNHKERISSRYGDNREYGTLNNKGGFYYNKKTGEVKLNLTEPLKSYFFIYFGKGGDEIPADW